jgi:hypothetical protein
METAWELNFVISGKVRKLLRLTARRDVVLDNPGPFECNGVEEPEGGVRDNDGTGRETSLPRQVEQSGPDLRRSEKVWRFTKMAGEVDDLRDIRTLRVRSQVPNLHVFDHTSEKRAHGQLLCEMDCATWRPAIVSRLSCQAGRTWWTVATAELSNIRNT